MKMNEELQSALKRAKKHLLFLAIDGQDLDLAIDGQDFDLVEVTEMFAEPEDQEQLFTLLEEYVSPKGKFEAELEFTRWRVNKWRSNNA
jgi:hypothetical protein